jgi:SAM-dependent methyltransferase
VDWFRAWFDSPYYHKLYADRNEKEAAAFIDVLLLRLKPPPGSRMIDVACGRGRHARILADRGYDVTGIDLSPANIAYARAFRSDHLDFFVHDMRRILCTNCFGYAFNFFTSFGYFRTRREHDQSIRTISLALSAEGIFVLDYLNTRYIEDHLVQRSEKVIDDIRFDISRWSDETHFYKKIRIADQTLREPLEFTEKVAKFSLGDFSELFARAGLEIREVYGGYGLEPYDPVQSPRLLLLAQKKS